MMPEASGNARAAPVALKTDIAPLSAATSRWASESLRRWPRLGAAPACRRYGPMAMAPPADMSKILAGGISIAGCTGK